jgi:hypothetical protein
LLRTQKSLSLNYSTSNFRLLSKFEVLSTVTPYSY